MAENEIIRNWILDPKEEIAFDEIVSNPRILKVLFGNEYLTFDRIVGFSENDSARPDFYKITIIAHIKGMRKALIVDAKNISFDFMEELERRFGPRSK